jgi:hypothetical protein
VSAGAGAVGAYLASELVKVVVREDRPCHVLDVSTLSACPEPGDWSWPSNHSVIAAALATTVVILAPAWWRAAVPCALAVGASRVLTGAHYWHDVAAGLLVGGLVVWMGTWYLVRPAYRLLGSHPLFARLSGEPGEPGDRAGRVPPRTPRPDEPEHERPNWVLERINDVSRSASRATTTPGAGQAGSSDDAWPT